MRLATLALGLCGALSIGAAGCAFDDADVSSTNAASTSANGWSVNGWSVNGWSVNGWSVNGWSVNGWDPDDLKDYLDGKSALEKLLDEPLNRDTPIVAALAMTPEGEALLRYSVKCALPQGDVLELHDTASFQLSGDPADKVMPGNLGLFDGGYLSNWPDQGLDHQEREYYLACMLSHINLYGAHVTISLLTDHPALDTPDAGFTAFEGGFYGKLDSSGTPTMKACYGDDLFAACGYNEDITVNFLNTRVCAQPGGCPGFDVVGPCVHTPVLQVATPACTDHTKGLLFGCVDDANSPTHDWEGRVMAVYQRTISCGS